ncbi:MAG: hypothetical protein EHJ94_08715 [Deltaproteobacteria bacterium]|nr:MAG: hypothetical protein EHJ94_08715 [Deltaproteobacteria bacterium]
MRFINISREAKLDSVKRHRKWQQQLKKDPFFDAVFPVKRVRLKIVKEETIIVKARSRYSDKICKIAPYVLKNDLRIGFRTRQDIL